MEHSVCKVSLAHHTKEWLSALFEALDGLELSVNNYLYTLLWIACRNKRLSHHLYQRLSANFPPRHNSTLYGAQNQKEWGGGDTVCDHVRRFSEHTCPYIVSHVDEAGLSCHDPASRVFSELTFIVFLKRAAQLSGERTPCNRWYISVDVWGRVTVPQTQAENFSFDPREFKIERPCCSWRQTPRSFFFF